MYLHTELVIRRKSTPNYNDIIKYNYTMENIDEYVCNGNRQIETK